MTHALTWYEVNELVRQAAASTLPAASPWPTYLLGGLFIAVILVFLSTFFREGEDMQSLRVSSIMALVAIVLAVVFLHGCTTTAVQGAAQTRLEKVTATDLDAAIAAATAANDPQAVLCFTKVKDFVGQDATPADIKGVFSAFESARILRRRVDTGVPEDLHVACAPLIVDARMTLLKLGLIAGGL